MDSSVFWFLVPGQLQPSLISWWLVSNVFTFHLLLWVAFKVHLTFHLIQTLKFINLKSRFLIYTFQVDLTHFEFLCRLLASDDRRLLLALCVFQSRVALCWFYRELFQVLSLTASNDLLIFDSNLKVLSNILSWDEERRYFLLWKD